MAQDEKKPPEGGQDRYTYRSQVQAAWVLYGEIQRMRCLPRFAVAQVPNKLRRAMLPFLLGRDVPETDPANQMDAVQLACLVEWFMVEMSSGGVPTPRTQPFEIAWPQCLFRDGAGYLLHGTIVGETCPAG